MTDEVAPASSGEPVYVEIGNQTVFSVHAQYCMQDSVRSRRDFSRVDQLLIEDGCALLRSLGKRGCFQMRK